MALREQMILDVKETPEFKHECERLEAKLRIAMNRLETKAEHTHGHFNIEAEIKAAVDQVEAEMESESKQNSYVTPHPKDRHST